MKVRVSSACAATHRFGGPLSCSGLRPLHPPIPPHGHPARPPTCWGESAAAPRCLPEVSPPPLIAQACAPRGHTPTRPACPRAPSASPASTSPSTTRRAASPARPPPTAPATAPLPPPRAPEAPGPTRRASMTRSSALASRPASGRPRARARPRRAPRVASRAPAGRRTRSTTLPAASRSWSSLASRASMWRWRLKPHALDAAAPRAPPCHTPHCASYVPLGV